MIPASYTVDDYRLGQWVTIQRGNNSRGNPEADRRRRLQNLPGWTWDPGVDKWELGFSHLLRYVERHNDSRVPQSYKADDYPLGAWASSPSAWATRSKAPTERLPLLP